jgi:hypothetical protein
MKTTKAAIFGSVNLSAASSLAEVKLAVKSGEQSLGPLVMMKIDNDMTLLKFSATLPRPKAVALVAPQVNGKPVIPAGAELVAAGQIFLEGSPTLCAATRAQAES